MQTITLVRPDDWHLHVRDDAALEAVVPHTAVRFGRALIMPNLKPPVTTTAQALAYRERILAAAHGTGFQPLMSLYLTDNLPVDEIDRAKASGHIAACKLYPAGATTNSDAGVTAIDKLYPVLERMEKLGMVLCVHGEATGAEVDVFDRERVFIERTLSPLVRRFPGLKVVFEHITTAEAAQFVRAAGANVAATVTAHHLLLNRNAIFAGGIRPHHYCLPVLKRESHREALVSAVTSGNRYRFCAPRAEHQGERLRVRRLLHGTRRDRAVCRGVRCGGRARAPRGLRQPERPGLLRPGTERRHHHPAPRGLERARELPLPWRRCAGAAARG